jgi:hypothetical protein
MLNISILCSTNCDEIKVQEEYNYTTKNYED